MLKLGRHKDKILRGEPPDLILMRLNVPCTERCGVSRSRTCCSVKIHCLCPGTIPDRLLPPLRRTIIPVATPAFSPGVGLIVRRKSQQSVAQLRQPRSITRPTYDTNYVLRGLLRPTYRFFLRNDQGDWHGSWINCQRGRICGIQDCGEPTPNGKRPQPELRQRKDEHGSHAVGDS